MDATSPPVTPIRQYTSPFESTPTTSPRGPFRRRTSSLSSNHDRSSPVSLRSKHRFSGASQYSNDFSADGGGGGGLGNLADELDQMDDEGEDEDQDEDVDMAEGILDAQQERGSQPSPVDGARDSGIDVSYSSKTTSPTRVRNFSKPFGLVEKTPYKMAEEQEEKLTPELEDLINSVARMAAYASTSEDPLIPRFVDLLQDLGNQSNVEAGVQRLNTSTNSMTSHFAVQSRTFQGLTTSLFPPLAAISTPLDPETLEEVAPLIDALLKALPQPNPAPYQGIQKLVRDTDNVVQTLAQLTDTLQMGKHTTNAAARHLRTTQTMVAELRRERERADTAREEPQRLDWNDRIRDRWCAGQCRDIMGGFEQMCDSLRETLLQAGSA